MTSSAVQNARNIFSRMNKPRRNSVNHSKERKELEEQLSFFKGELKRLEALGGKADVSSIERLIKKNMDEISEKLEKLNAHHGGRRVTFRRKVKRSKSTRGRK